MKLFIFFMLFVTHSWAVDYKSGDRIIDQYGNTGAVHSLFTNGTAEIFLDDFPSQSFVRSLSTLGKGYKCINSLCVGKKIVDQYGNVGILEELFHNGMASISLFMYDGFFSRDLSSLGIHLSCISDETCNYTPLSK